MNAPGLRPATAADDAFLFQLYASTREEELAAVGWPDAQKTAFLRAQFAARDASYRTSFPDAEHRVILDGRTAIGALMVHRSAAEIRLVSLAILPAHRGAGHGTRLLRLLMEEASASTKPLSLHVLKGDRAEQFYTRLGFAPSGENGLYLRMEWRG